MFLFGIEKTGTLKNLEKLYPLPYRMGKRIIVKTTTANIKCNLLIVFG